MIVLLPGALAAAFFAMPLSDGVRDRFLRAVVAWGVAIWALTELLGWLRMLDRRWLAIAWSALIAAAVVVSMGLRPAKADEDAASGVGQAVPPAKLAERAVGRRKRPMPLK